MATVLEIVQDMLNVVDGDKVNSISDTIESEQCANIVRQNFDIIIDQYQLTATKAPFRLTGLGDTNLPTAFDIPDDVSSVDYVRYDTKLDPTGSQNYTDIRYLSPKDFIDLVTKRDSTQTNVQTCTVTGNITLYIFNDKAPEFYTTFDDQRIFMDSFDSDVESTLQTSKTSCYGEKKLALTVDDSTEIPLPHYLTTLLRTQSLEMACEIWKEGAPLRIRQDAMRSRIASQRQRRRLRVNQEKDLFTGPNYGRRV